MMLFRTHNDVKHLTFPLSILQSAVRLFLFCFFVTVLLNVSKDKVVKVNSCKSSVGNYSRVFVRVVNEIKDDTRRTQDHSFMTTVVMA